MPTTRRFLSNLSKKIARKGREAFYSFFCESFAKKKSSLCPVFANQRKSTAVKYSCHRPSCRVSTRVTQLSCPWQKGKALPPHFLVGRYFYRKLGNSFPSDVLQLVLLVSIVRYQALLDITYKLLLNYQFSK